MPYYLYVRKSRADAEAEARIKTPPRKKRSGKRCGILQVQCGFQSLLQDSGEIDAASVVKPHLVVVLDFDTHLPA